MKFAVRLGILGFAFMAMFSVIGLRLWFIQVAEGPAIALAAEDRTWLIRSTRAPRGNIYDRTGTLMATSRLLPAVEVDRTFVQPEQRPHLIQRLSALLAIPAEEIDAMYERSGLNGRFQVATVSAETALRINEQLDALPGVEVVSVPERVYLTGPTGSHIIGHLGLPNQADLEENPELASDVRIGKLGVERVYDQILQGTPGSVEYRVRRGEIVDQRDPVEPAPGNAVQLTIDLELQQLVEIALVEGIDLSNAVKEARREQEDAKFFSATERGAAVVLDVETFEVIALASVPDFDPQLFVAGIDSDTFDDLNATRAFNNLAISGLYPPASTFKAITYTVIEQENLPFPEEIEGVDSARREVHCDGTLELPELADGSAQVKNDWYAPRNIGWLDIHGALEQSCNIFFWSTALGTWQRFGGTPRENVIQDWAKDLGYGSQTGIDLSNEASGIVPTRELFEEWAEQQRENPEDRRLDPSRLEARSPFFGGDLMDFAIGQGTFTATPLQVAVSYAVLANGGTVREPRVVSRILDQEGGPVRDIESPIIDTLPISRSVRAGLLEDLNRVVTVGTARQAFADFGEGLGQVGGKTGTSQSTVNRDNHAWFVGVAPLSSPRYVVVVVLDEGGSGGQVAAPVARHILQELMGNEPTPIVEGEATD